MDGPLETLNVIGCTSFTNLTKSSFPTGYSTTHLKLSYGGLEHVEADSLLVSFRDQPNPIFTHSAACSAEAKYLVIEHFCNIF